MSNFEVTYSIVKALVLPAVRRRSKNSNGLQIKIMNKMKRFIDIKDVFSRLEPDCLISNTGRGFECVESVVRIANYKVKEIKLNNCWRQNSPSFWSLFASSTKPRSYCADCKKWNIFSVLYTYVRYISMKVLWHHQNGIKSIMRSYIF